MSQITLDSVPSNIKWASFGIVPGALVAMGIQGSNLVGGNVGKPLVVGGKTAALAATIAFNIETIRAMPLPQDRHASALLGAATGAVMLGATGASFKWLVMTEGSTMSIAREVGQTGFRYAALGLVAGAVAGALLAGKGSES